ncbi:MAG: class I SAM-dependent methyltransferase [Candidatus Acidiferrales bacterium]
MQNKDIVGQWSESAPYWEKYRPAVREMFAPVAQALIEDAGIASRSAVLDVATGTGEPALSIADVVGPEGRVVGVDPAQEMVEYARCEAVRLNLHHAGFQVAFSDNLPFPDGAFDAVVSRFGVMFFPSPEDSVREMLRVLKPHGRLALAVWHSAEKNPFDYVFSRIVDRYLEPTPQAPGSANMFRFAKPGDLLAVLSRSGANVVSERLLQFSIRASMSAEKFWTLRSEMSEKLRTRLALLSQPQWAEIRREVIEALQAYSSDGAVSFPAEVLIVSGAK